MSVRIANADAPAEETKIYDEVKLAKRLHAEMERLDPTDGKIWEQLDLHQHEFYRLCIRVILREINLSEHQR